ncbi:hypothetical protein HY624_02495 [Candidatus Uhrbacteria bacterium]|nr:hypothetical protein [Candidatus Uhrbacteria bacterium]
MNNSKRGSIWPVIFVIGSILLRELALRHQSLSLSSLTLQFILFVLLTIQVVSLILTMGTFHLFRYVLQREISDGVIPIDETNLYKKDQVLPKRYDLTRSKTPLLFWFRILVNGIAVAVMLLLAWVGFSSAWSVFTSITSI